MQDAGEISGDDNERGLPQREHAGESEDQVQANKGDCNEGGNRRQRRSPARQDAEIRQSYGERERDCDYEIANSHARLPPPNLILRDCHSATMIRTPKMTGSCSSAPK